MKTTEIKLSEKQLQIIGNILTLKQNIQNEYAKVAERESEFVINLCEAKGVDVLPDAKIEIKEGVLIVPVAEPQLKKTK